VEYDARSVNLKVDTARLGQDLMRTSDAKRCAFWPFEVPDTALFPQK